MQTAKITKSPHPAALKCYFNFRTHVSRKMSRVQVGSCSASALVKHFLGRGRADWDGNCSAKQLVVNNGSEGCDPAILGCRAGFWRVSLGGWGGFRAVAADFVFCRFGEGPSFRPWDVVAVPAPLRRMQPESPAEGAWCCAVTTTSGASPKAGSSRPWLFQSLRRSAQRTNWGQVRVFGTTNPCFDDAQEDASQTAQRRVSHPPSIPKVIGFSLMPPPLQSQGPPVPKRMAGIPIHPTKTECVECVFWPGDFDNGGHELGLATSGVARALLS